MMCLCVITLLVCFTLACPQSYNQRRPQPFNNDYDYPSNDWEFAQQRNGYQNRLNNPYGFNNFNPRGNPGRQYELRHMLEDRSYDLAYGMGTGYGQKLGSGIKNGVQQETLKKLLSGLGLKPDEKEKEGEERKKDKEKEEP